MFLLFVIKGYDVNKSINFMRYSERKRYPERRSWAKSKASFFEKYHGTNNNAFDSNNLIIFFGQI